MTESLIIDNKNYNILKGLFLNSNFKKPKNNSKSIRVFIKTSKAKYFVRIDMTRESKRIYSMLRTALNEKDFDQLYQFLNRKVDPY